LAKQKRRSHNEGSVYYANYRGRWVAEVTTDLGKRKRYYCKTEREAIRKKNEMLRELEQGTLATGPQRKLGEYLEDWLENVQKGQLRISSYVKYKKNIKYVVAELGDVWLQKLTPEQARAFLESVRQHRLEVLLTLTVVTGMRRGELVALRWSSVDLNRKTLLVLHTVDYIPNYGYVETEPKTAAGKRMINLPDFLIDMLKQHRTRLLEQQLKMGETWENHDLVFPDLHGGYFNPGYLDKLFTRLLREAGVTHMHFHDLRHSAATILLSMGVNIKVIQQLLGHSDIAITLRVYCHLLPSMQEEAVERWEDAFMQGDDEANGQGG
jgi:integrase